MIERSNPQISVRRQCTLVGLNRSSLYYPPTQETEENLLVMRLIDQQYTRTPFYGSRRMTHWLGRAGHEVNRKRVQRLMRKMGLEAVYPRPRLSQAAPEHKVYPYLLRGIEVRHPDQVWSTDITYIPMQHGFMYLVAVMDWHSRYILSWQLSNTMDVNFCLTALEQALEKGGPEIFNTDQGSQFTSQAFTGRLEEAGVAISMDGRGRVLDNIFVERLWRTVKYEDIYIKGYATVAELEAGLAEYFWFYNHERPHQALEYQTPAEVYSGNLEADVASVEVRQVVSV
jgi:putative transposase